MSAARAAVVAALLAGPAVGRPPDDATLERRLSAALAADPRLGQLTVSVGDRVAVVGGTGPDAAAKRAAEATVQRADGFEAVRLNVWVPLRSDPFADAVKRQLHPPATPPPARPTPPPPGDLPPLALPLPGGLPPLPPVVEPVVAERQPDRRTWLAPPVAGTAGTIPPPGVPAAPPARFATLTSANPRFRRLTVDVSPGGTAVIGGAGDPAAAWELAAVLRHQPGVTRVVVGPVAER